MRRWISLIVAVAMLAPATASFAEGAMATWLSPQPGQIVSGGRVEVAIGYNTQSKLKVSSLELYVDGQFLTRKVLRAPESRGVCSFYWDTTGVEQGSHSLVVKVFAGDQMISKIFGTGTVGPNGSSRGLLDVRPPVVTFANIKAGDVLKGSTTIKLNAVDDSGQSPMVSLLVDDVLKLLRNTPPYNYDLDTTTYADGDHSLKTYAYDAAGNRSDPSVVKVAFRNGGEKPMVTSLSVNHDPEPQMAEAKLSQSTPPSIDASSDSRIKSAARAETRMDMSTSAVAPVVAEPKAKVVALAPKPISVQPKLAAPRLEGAPKTLSAASVSELKSSHVGPKFDGRIAAAVIPDIKSAPISHKISSPVMTAKPVRMASASLPSDIRSAIAKPGASSSASSAPIIKEAKAAAPKAAVPSPKASASTRMAMAQSTASLRPAAQKLVADAAVAAAPGIVDEAAVSATRSLPAGSAVNTKAAQGASAKASPAMAAKPSISTPGALSKSALKAVRVAMAPNLRSAVERTVPSPAIACPPAAPKVAKARIEKTTIPATGKVRARDYFQKMGGVLFWDPSTHTVTACVGDVVLEMRIGSKMAKVNGHQFEMAVAPFLAKDRTIFDAGSFAEACRLIDGLKTVGMAD